VIRAVLLLLAILCAGCPPPPDPIVPEPQPTSSATTDPLDARPELEPPSAYNAPEPIRYQTPAGINVWLIHRPSLPIVSMELSLPCGSAEDPLGKGGLANATVLMLDEGAGDRDALTISAELNDLGADLDTGVGVDGSGVSLTVLKKHLDKGFAIFADVVARPTFDNKEWKRVSDLWHNRLLRRADSPGAVARVVRRAVVYGPGTPYGHSPGGQLASAKSITLAEVKAFYKSRWRPDQAHLVVAGAITRNELDALIAKHLSTWTKPSQAVPKRTEAQKPRASRPRLVLVDRPNAPQAVVLVAGVGVAADHPDAPLLDLVNTALGGSFTSRLNQNLREDHSWTYGARSSFLESRGTGAFIAQAAVFTNVTGAALREMLAEIDKMAASGLTDDELHKVRARDLTDLIETHETVDDLVSRLGTLATLGLPHDFDAKASVARQAASKQELDTLAKRYLATKSASIIVVGPREQMLTQLRALDLGDPEFWSPDGKPLKKNE
jgi:zinc protease